MWIAIFASGALLLHRADWPRSLSAGIPHGPPPWAPYALYFLLAALLRLAIRDARLRPLKRRARAIAEKTSASPLGVADFGMGVGKGLASVVVGGDFLGAVWAGVDLVVRWLMGSKERARRRIPAAVREAMAREKRRALVCIVVVGVICAAQVVEPDLLPAATASALALAGVGF